jgi:hypothetical protein
LTLVVCAFGLWRGQRYERLVACLFLASLTLGQFLQAQMTDRHNSLALWWEGLEFMFLAWLAVRNGALWLILIAALQLLDLATVAVHRWAPQVAGDYAYESLALIWNLDLRIVLFLATLAAIQRTKAERVAWSALRGSQPLSQGEPLGAH